MDIDLNKVQQLLSFVDAFRKVERNMYAVSSDRMENDSEHVFELTILCWYLVAEYNKQAAIKLDEGLVIKYSLVHDLVEAYAGDTDIYADPRGDAHLKAEREAAALEKIKEEFTFFENIPNLIEKYEKQEDEEARFVYSIDKSVFSLAQLRDDFKSWKTIQFEQTLEGIDEKKQPKLTHPVGKNLWEKIKEEIVSRGGFYWKK